MRRACVRGAKAGSLSCLARPNDLMCYLVGLGVLISLRSTSRAPRAWYCAAQWSNVNRLRPHIIIERNDEALAAFGSEFSENRPRAFAFSHNARKIETNRGFSNIHFAPRQMPQLLRILADDRSHCTARRTALDSRRHGVNDRPDASSIA